MLPISSPGIPPLPRDRSWCIIANKTMISIIIRPLALAILVITLFLASYAARAANGDFSIRLVINGDDLTEMETIVLDPKRDITVDIHIFDVTRDVTLEKISVAVTFAGQTVYTLSQDLGDFHIAADGDFRKQITANAGDALGFGGRPLVTGIYRTVITLEYTADNQPKTWSEAGNIKFAGNPLNTPAGAAGVVIGGGTLAAVFWLIKSLAAPGLPAGAVLPTGTPVRSLPGLRNLVAERLEPTARGRLMGNITRTARGRIIKDRCPVCGTRFKHGYCYPCRKSAKEVRKEYADRVTALVLQSGKLLASGQVATLDELCSRLGIDVKLGTDVIATLRHARLVKVKGMASKLMGKAVMVGIGSGLSTILWITMGGLVVLSSSALVVTLAASIVLPVAITKGFQIKAKRTLKKPVK